ncbi:MAG: TetR/AcrR family transcriptional regulator [Anaerolineae bacterium]|nr:TetR/AcrR family transcriptional regulator [Anaerolineae bacterium]
MKKSRAAINRQQGKHQVDEQRDNILAAAEMLFLHHGLEKTKMIDIATQAGITKMTLYRYFPNLDPIAFEVAGRMLETISTIAARSIDQEVTGLAAIRENCLGMIREFVTLRSAYRYIGMFDHLYGDKYPSDELASWYKKRIFDLMDAWPFSKADLDQQGYAQVITLLNTIMSFLEKMAARGELMAEEQEVPLQTQLAAFEEIVLVYLKTLGDSNDV